MRLPGVIIALVLVLPWTSLAQDSRRLVEQKGLVDVGEELEDVLVVDGRLEVKGLVRGHLFALDSKVFVRRSAVLVGSVTVVGGAFHLEDGAVLPGNIELTGAEFYGPGGQTLSPGGSLKVASGSTTVSMEPAQTSTLSAALTRAVLPFDRYIPGDDLAVEALNDWSPGLGLTVREAPQSDDAVVIGGRIRLKVVSERVLGTLQRGFEGVRGKVLLTVVKLDAVASAEDLWERIAAAPVAEKGRVSIKSEVLEGSHWFFRSRGRYTTVWQRGRWLMAVETRFADDDATVTQQQQFNRQVLESFRETMPEADPQELER